MSPYYLKDQARLIMAGNTIVAEASVFVPEAEANANLIAAAPDMYEALKAIIAEGTRCLDEVQQDTPVSALYNIDLVDRIAKQALAKAEGK